MVFGISDTDFENLVEGFWNYSFDMTELIFITLDRDLSVTCWLWSIVTRSSGSGVEKGKLAFHQQKLEEEEEEEEEKQEFMNFWTADY